MNRILRVLPWLFSTWRFPVFTIATLGLTVLFMVVMLLWPASAGPLGSFAEDFKVWCFGYDPVTGELEWGYVFIFVLQPTVLALVIGGVWYGTVREALRQPRQTAPWALAGALFFAATVGAMVALQPAEAAPESGELPFPAEALRTEIPVQDFALTNQDGQTVALSELRGKVVMITAVYATCGDTCPRIFAQSRAAVAELAPAELADLRVLAITLDPERDTPEKLVSMAAAQKVASPVWNMLSGDPARVKTTLELLGFTWSRDEKTGVISHPNLFLLVDRQGRLAYRFTLGAQQQRWLVSGLKALLGEASAT